MVSGYWESQNPDIATVDDEGNVYAVSEGHTIIYYKVKDSYGRDYNYPIVVDVVKKTIDVAEISIIENSGEYIELNKDETMRLHVRITPDNASDKTIIWESSDAKIATVDDTGKVYALSPGVVKVTATANNGLTASCDIKVVSPVKYIELNVAEVEILPGDCYQLYATLMPEDCSDKTIYWRSTNEDVALVSVDGLISAISPGEALITATSANGVNAECKVICLAIPESIILNEESIAAYEGEVIKLEATILPENTIFKELYWYSSAENIASVSQDGLVSINSVGECDIIVQSADFKHIQSICHIYGLSGIESIYADKDSVYDIYSVNGMLVKSSANLEDFENLESGVYIINGVKIFKHR